MGVERLRLPRDPGHEEGLKLVLNSLAKVAANDDSPALTDRHHCELTSSCVWERARWRVFDRYLREVHFVPRLENDRPYELSGDTLRLGHASDGATMSLEKVVDSLSPGGACVNVISVHRGGAAVQPVPLRFTSDSLQTLRQDERLQQHIAHAFWQTVWAEGALRGAAGETAPVAFLPVIRGPFDDPGPTEVLALSSDRMLIGRDAIDRYWLWRACQAESLTYDHQARRFELVIGDARECEALEVLNAAGFADHWIGQNRELHQSGRRVVIRHLVPVAGCEVLSELAPRIDQSPYVPQELLGGNFLAATNSVFFLNFPEEYRNLHSAMNDLVGLLVVRGQMWQPPILRRSTLLIDEDGRATIAVVSMADCSLDLGGSIGRIERFALNPEVPPTNRPSVYTPVFAAHLPPEKNRTPEVETTDLVVVDGRVVEICTGGGTEIPMNGFVLSLPDVSAEWMVRHLWDYGTRVRIEMDLAHLGLGRVVTAMAAGPQLVRDGQPLSRDYLASGPEEFRPLHTGERGILQSGVPPTRFPHHVARVRAPRTAVGITEDDGLLLITVDGRNTEHSVGMTLLELARFLCHLGCREALNLDGGGSTVMYVSPERCDAPPLSSEIAKGIANWPSDVGSKDRLIPALLAVFELPDEDEYSSL
jgi:hypothetical protein